MTGTQVAGQFSGPRPAFTSAVGRGLGSPRRWRWLVLVVAGVLAMAGCSGIPDSGQPLDVGKVPTPSNADQPQPPVAGAQPDQIVLGFISAVGGSSSDPSVGNAFASAKLYLTPQARRSWQPATAAVVILSSYRVDPTGSAKGQVVLTGTPAGSLDTPTRVFHPAGTAVYSRKLSLQQVDGQWRISNPPVELLIPQQDFAQSFTRRALYFLDPGGSAVVPDPRYIAAAGTTEARVTRLLTLLFRGPSVPLAGVARTQLVGVLLRSSVTTTDGITQIDLTGSVPPAPAARRALAAQIVWTLSSLPGDVSQVSITVEGEPLEPAAKAYTLADFNSFDPVRSPGSATTTTTDPYYVDQVGRIIDINDGSPMWGALGDGTLQVKTAAMSAATGAVAAVVQQSDGTVQLELGRPLEFVPPRAGLKAYSLTQPSFTRAGDQVWVVQNGGTKPEVYSVSPAGKGCPCRVKVGTDVLNGKGPVTALALSPDGVRVAVVAGQKLYLGAIATGPADSAGAPPAGDTAVTASSIVNLAQLRTDLTQVGAVQFKNSTSLLVAAASGGSLVRSVRQVAIDGSELQTLTTSGLSNNDVDGIAVSDRILYISFSSRVAELDGNPQDGRWIPPPALAKGGAPVAGSQPFLPN